MKIQEIDKNFNTTFQCPEDMKWFSMDESCFSIHGVSFSEDEGLYRRLPKEIADVTNEGVAYLSKHTAGGRIRFATTSTYVAVRIEAPFEEPMSHMTIAGKDGVSIFVNHRFAGTIMPSYRQIAQADPAYGGNGKIIFDGIKGIHRHVPSADIYQVELFLPLYSAVNSIHIGLEKNCILQAPSGYKHSKPVLFYGSSITQGACASKPGDDYISRLSRMVDTDFINLGFSGSATAEQAIADYIAKQDVSVFVLDYDYNAPDAEYLEKTHFRLYETVRRANPTTPIIMMTMPTVAGYEERYEEKPWFKPRREIILNNVAKIEKSQDKNFYFIDCYGCFGTYENGECGTIDDLHPDSLGFLRMAEKVYPVLNKLLNESKDL